MVEDGVTGFVRENEAELVAVADRIAELDRRACRQRVEERFSVAAMTDGYEAVYRALAGNATSKANETGCQFCASCKALPCTRRQKLDVTRWTTPSAPSPAPSDRSILRSPYSKATGVSSPLRPIWGSIGGGKRPARKGARY